MARTLKQAIDEHRPLVVPSIYDGISALLVRDLGFHAAYIGSYATGAAKYGVPDIGYIGLEDMADQVRRLAPVAGVPIIVDGEGGWGNPLHVARSVQVLERAGAAATHIEDHVFGKHLIGKSHILPVGQAVDKIKAAVDARDSTNFMIIGRTDSFLTEGPAAAVDRVLAYQEAGADGVFVAGYLDAENQSRLRAEARVPIFTVDLPTRSAADHGAEGADVVLYYALAHQAAINGIRAALEVLAREGSTTSIEKELGSVVDLDAFLGIGPAREKARKYGLLD
ncbi:isocitrate lyase/PEP mutase family protein [Frankia gtarii]|uniref:isocitrate lyase/PEP mutase family protein n=1 Tax=Frankia gtarii TaxID=2950102 RepID=UPI0021C19955|nr:isocitrate lyase/phosphoenolpyruvate mutase family protein [Frankia gtarii]